jgi:hypothetical protein
MTPLGDKRFAVRLRRNGELRRYGSFEVTFAYGSEHLLAALRAGQAMSYRFIRDAKGWRVFASTAEMPVPAVSDARLGVIGADLNEKHVAVSETDRFGNIIGRWTIPLVTAELSRHATQTAISVAVKELIAIASERQKPISIEELCVHPVRADRSRARVRRRDRRPGRQSRL